MNPMPGMTNLFTFFTSFKLQTNFAIQGLITFLKFIYV